MTTPLAAEDQIEAALGRPLTDAETTRAEQLNLLASAYVADKTRYRFAPGSYTVGRKVRGGAVSLPAKAPAVTEVRAVDQCDGTVTTLDAGTYNTHGRKVYGLHCWKYVEVDFTVSEAVPDEIAALVAGMIAATLEGPSANVASESAGAFSRSFVSSSGRVYLAESDKAVLRRYSMPRAALDVL